ncbi:hypothetical protein CISIN_1g046413mg, partial [Citrus sinensis]
CKFSSYPKFFGNTTSKKFVTPRFKFYNGTSDPINHIRHFRQTMALYEHEDALMCRIFPSSLDSLPLNWYHDLPSSSIHEYV